LQSSICKIDRIGNQTKPKTVKEITGLVNQYCGSCHNPPSPQLLPKRSWPQVIKAMAKISKRSMGQEFISAEHIKDITAYYYGTSPTSLPRLPYFSAEERNRTFIGKSLVNKSKLPMIFNIKPVHLFQNDNTEFLFCDGEKNQVSLLSIVDGIWKEQALADIILPSQTEVVDYDLDGDQDIIVASLGVLFPSQGTGEGKVTLLRQSKSGVFEQEILLENVGRVTDVQALDIDGDNDLDVAIAIFGADVHGELAWLENLGNGKHLKHSLMKSSGGLNISPIDLNNDGLIDFVTLITQQHELVAGLVNNGDGSFKRIKLFQAPHPLVGFTSIKLVDLDGDKDLDMLMTNGDANDLQEDPKPYHGIQWLENTGKLNFQYHDIGRFYGAVSAAAGDLDADGDLDIVTSSWNNYWDDPKRQSIIWFENDGKQNFQRHNISSTPHSITSLDLTDINKDGFLDIIAGVFRIDLLKSFYNEPDEKSNDKNIDQTRIVLFENHKVDKK
jgi:hypothetical protein